MASRTLRRKAALATALALGVAALGAGAGALVHEQIDASATCMNSGATVVTRGPRGECVGITDGSFLFGPAERGMTPADRAALTAVEKDFRAENQKVATGGTDYASVAYLLPIAARGVESPKTIIEQLQGAYTAQVRDNATADGGLQIKVLLVSDGLQGAGWATAVADIQRAVASQHVAVVAGLGVSIASTMSAVLKLTRGRSAIPVVGSSITSDAYDNIKNLVRVSPSNTDDVDEALAYIKPRFRTAVLVEDTNPADSYDQTLIREFSRGFPDRTHAFVDHEPYNTGIPGAATAFPQIAADICTAKHSAVLFAGRGKNLATLISALADQCEDQPVTIITGDDVVDMSMSPTVSSGLREHVTLDYAGTASPDEWSGSAADVTAGRGGFDTFRQAFEQHFSSASFADGSAMTGYDATLTSIAAIRLTRNLHPSPAEVVQVIGQLKGSRKVLGATGPIALSADYGGSAKTGSNPVQKAIPILQLEPSGSVRFLELDWSPTVAGELGEAGLVP